MIEIKLTVTITDPARASENASIPGGTFLLFSSFTGCKNTTAAPIHVDAPATHER